MGLVQVLSTGHSATLKLARVLDKPELGIRFHHELRNTVAREHGIDVFNDDPAAWSPYGEALRRELETYAVVGDAKSWAPRRLIETADRMPPISHVVFLVRNGIQVVHSLFFAESRGKWITDDYYERFREAFEVWNMPTEFLTPFGCECFNWARYAHRVFTHHPRFIGRFPTLAARIEDLMEPGTPDLRHLFQTLHPGIRLPGDDVVEQWKQGDMNRHIRGNRDPEYLMSQWTAEQQETFCAVCGDGMTYWGYEVPDVAPSAETLAAFSVANG